MHVRLFDRNMSHQNRANWPPPGGNPNQSQPPFFQRNPQCRLQNWQTSNSFSIDQSNLRDYAYNPRNPPPQHFNNVPDLNVTSQSHMQSLMSQNLHSNFSGAISYDRMPQSQILPSVAPLPSHSNMPPPSAIPSNLNYMQPPPQFQQFNPPPNMPPRFPLPSQPTNFTGPPPPTFNQTYLPPITHGSQLDLPPPNQPSNFSQNKSHGSNLLQQWISKNSLRFKKIEARKDKKKTEAGSQVWQYMAGLRDLSKTLTDMSKLIDGMASNVSTSGDTAWNISKSDCIILKDKIACGVKEYLEDSQVAENKKRFSKVRQRRERLKRAKAVKFESFEKTRQEWAEKDKQIDKWQERIRVKIQEENKEKRRKLEADRTLSKVTREIHDASRLIDTMLALQKLRLIRRDAAQKRGDSDIGESRQQFEEKIEDMTRLVKGQLDCYKIEEAKLKQVLKSEEEAKNKLELQVEEDKAKKLTQEEDMLLRSMLFGKNEIPLDVSLFPFYQYYTQAQHNIAALLQIRQDWDTFVVPQATPASSTIPSGWVMPEEPSSSVWGTSLQ